MSDCRITTGLHRGRWYAHEETDKLNEKLDKILANQEVIIKLLSENKEEQQ